MTSGGPGSALLAPKVLLPLLAVLAAATVGLGVALAMKDSKQILQLETCEAGTPGCELRAPVHYHADFAIFVRGEQIRFDRDEYISHPNKEVNPAVHIHEPRYSVVHVHRSNTTWDEFFSSLGFRLTDTTVLAGAVGSSLELPNGEKLEESETETFKFFVNGVQVDGVALSNIADLDRVLISFGPESADEVLRTQWPLVTDEACIPSGRCQERIPDDEPIEICAGGQACTA